MNNKKEQQISVIRIPFLNLYVIKENYIKRYTTILRFCLHDSIQANFIFIY